MNEPSFLHLVEPARDALLAVASDNIMQRSTPQSAAKLQASMDLAVTEAATRYNLNLDDTLSLAAFVIAGVQVLAQVLAGLGDRVREIAGATAEREAGAQVQ